jgi:uncharacterized protein (TIGR02186 family)
VRRGAAIATMAVAATLVALPAGAETLTVAISTDEIRIDSNFTGATVTIFGVIQRDASTVSRASSYDVAVVLRGPAETVVARRKDRILGIWANRAAATIVDAPSVYAIATSRPLDEIADEGLLRRFQIGTDNLELAMPEGGSPSEVAEFRQAFLRLKTESGLFAEQRLGVSFIGDSVFRADLRAPANIPAGNYLAEVYLFAGGALLAQSKASVSVVKTGFEEYMYAASRNQALTYGLACVALALFTGWLAGVIFRRD